MNLLSLIGTKKKLFIILRWLVVIVTSYMVIFGNIADEIKLFAYSLVLIFILSNIFLSWLPEDLFNKPNLNYISIIVDTMFVSSAIYITGTSNIDFFLMYFLLVILSTTQGDLKGLLITNIVIIFFYVWTSLKNKAFYALIYDANFLLKIPFLFIVSLFYGFLIQKIKDEELKREALKRETEEEKIELETKLEKTEGKYKELILSSSDGIFILQEGKFVFVNPGFSNMLGYTEEEINEKKISLYKIIAKESKPYISKKIRIYFKDNKLEKHLELIGKTKAGEKKHFEISIGEIEYNGMPAMQGFIRDITLRKTLEKEKEASEKRLRAILNNVEIGFIKMEENGIISFINNTASFYLKLYTDKSTRWESLFPHKGENCFHCFITANFKKGETKRWEFKHGGRFFSSILTPVPGAFEEPLSLILSLSDITKIKKAEIETYEKNIELMKIQKKLLKTNTELQEAIELLNKTQQQLIQSEKMYAVGRLVSGVAHELNNPLAGIMGLAQLLIYKDIDEKLKFDLKKINEEAQRASRIIQNLLTFARQQKPEKKPVQVEELIAKVIDIKTYDFRLGNITIEKDFSDNIPFTYADGNQLLQVFLNLISNAEDAIKKKGKPGLIKIKIEIKGENILISFADNGCGMPEEILNRIYEPFFTTRDVGKGTGLGLSICYGIIEEHNGKIWAESTETEGSTFFINLPVVKKMEIEVVPETKKEITLQQVKGKKVLIMDDEPTTVYLLKEHLENLGFITDAYLEGKKALESIETNDYDIAIVDVKMPEMDGRMFYKKIETFKPSLINNIIFLTGESVSKETAAFLNGKFFFTKPFQLEQLDRKIRELCS